MHYVLERRESQKKTFMPVMPGVNVLDFVVKDLMVNSEYYFRVKAVNRIGSGEYIELRNPVIIEEQKRKYNYNLNNCNINPIIPRFFIVWLIIFILCILLFEILQSGLTHQLRLRDTTLPLNP